MSSVVRFLLCVLIKNALAEIFISKKIFFLKTSNKVKYLCNPSLKLFFFTFLLTAIVVFGKFFLFLKQAGSNVKRIKKNKIHTQC